MECNRYWRADALRLDVLPGFLVEWLKLAIFDIQIALTWMESVSSL